MCAISFEDDGNALELKWWLHRHCEYTKYQRNVSFKVVNFLIM